MAALAVGAGLLAASGLSARAALADYLASQSIEGLRKALVLAPANSQYWEVLALQLPVASREYRQALENAVGNDSHNSRLWMKLGAAAAATGEYARAESSYLEAAKFNRGYDPHWLLANLYFRQGEARKFWEQMREALGYENRDLGAGFELCWAMTQDAGEILRIVPHKPRILTRYLGFLLATNRMDEAAAVAELLVTTPPGADKGEAPVLVSYCDRLLEAKRHQEAYRIWEALAKKSLVPGSNGRSNLLVNGELQEAFTGRGFDWRWEAPGNIGRIQIPGLKQAEFHFDGNQPEKCELLRQFLALQPGAAYRLKFDYQTLDIKGRSGLRWRLMDTDAGEVQMSEEMASFQSFAWRNSMMLFRVPAQSRGQELTLGYEHQRGTVPIIGSLSVRVLVLERVD
jgi:tetratricopeptide (TPR) repeat protein